LARKPSLTNECLKLRTFAPDQFETWVFSKGSRCRCDGLWITINCDQPAFGSELLQNFPTVSPAAERSVDVTAVWFYFQSLKDRPQQHRHMRVAAHGWNNALERDRLEVGRHFAVVILVEPRIAFFVPGCFIPKFKLVALSDQHRLLLETRKFP